MRTRSILALSLALSAAAASCGSDPANVAGDYTMALTNRENGCAFTNWNEGDTSSGIPMLITQSGADITAVVGGLSGTFLQAWLGSNVYNGTASVNSIDLAVDGNRVLKGGNCNYTINSTIAADLNIDTLTGEIRYTRATDGSADCAQLAGCLSRQSFNGTRPPR